VTAQICLQPRRIGDRGRSDLDQTGLFLPGVDAEGLIGEIEPPVGSWVPGVGAADLAEEKTGLAVFIHKDRSQPGLETVLGIAWIENLVDTRQMAPEGGAGGGGVAVGGAGFHREVCRINREVEDVAPLDGRFPGEPDARHGQFRIGRVGAVLRPGNGILGAEKSVQITIFY